MTTHAPDEDSRTAVRHDPDQPGTRHDLIATDVVASSSAAATIDAPLGPSAGFPAAPPPLPTPGVTAADSGGWLALPARARWLYIVSTAMGVALVALAASIVLALVGLRSHAWMLLPGALSVGAAVGALYGNRRYVNTRWRHDGDGFALRRGRLWQSDTRVPGSRVQHLDLKRGPIERLCGLATLVVHTAGTRHSAVALSGLDHADAERLRDALSRQTDDDDDR